MKIQDYLHLYIGCEVKTTGGKFGKLVSVSTDGMAIIVYGGEDPRGRVIMQSAIIPILRTLSDMTEEEKDKYYSFWANIISKNPKQIMKLDAQTTIYLLSKHFDLFDLIPAGLALNAAHLNNKPKTEKK